MGKYKLYSLWIIVLNIIVFVLQVYIPGFTELFILNSKAVLGFQIWRFLTAIFLHADIIHLLLNTVALMFFGFVAEGKLGSRNFLLAYFGTGIIANIIAVNFYSSSLGASGAIYGIIGVLAIVAPFMMIWAFGLLMPMIVAAVIYAIADLLRTLGYMNPGNIGTIAHLSGIGFGILLGIFFRIYLRKEIKKSREKIEIPEDYIRKWEMKYMKR